MVYLVLAGAASLSVLAFLLFEVWRRYPVPHVGYSPWLLAWILVPAMGVLGVPWVKEIGRWRYLVLGLWMAVAGLLIGIDAFNLLVTHQVWGERGLPEWGSLKW